MDDGVVYIFGWTLCCMLSIKPIFCVHCYSDHYSAINCNGKTEHLLEKQLISYLCKTRTNILPLTIEHYNVFMIYNIVMECMFTTKLSLFISSIQIADDIFRIVRIRNECINNTIGNYIFTHFQCWK